MRVAAQTIAGVYAVDVDAEEVEPLDGGALEPRPAVAVGLPRVVAASACGSTVVAVVDARPPIVVSHDAGTTWHESGRGLPPGRDVAVADDPDLVVYAARNRLYVSRDGGRFWTALPAELPEIERVAWLD